MKSLSKLEVVSIICIVVIGSFLAVNILADIDTSNNITYSENNDITSSEQQEQIPETIIYEGSGDDLIDITRPDSQKNYLIYIEGNNSENHFSVLGVDDSGNDTILFVNTVEYYEGLNLAYADGITQSNPTEKLEISSATGDNWYIEVRPIEKAVNITGRSSYRNSGDYVFKIDESVGSVAINRADNMGNFIVEGYTSDFKNYDLLVNEIGSYKGTVRVSSNVRCFAVTAPTSSSWEFDF